MGLIDNFFVYLVFGTACLNQQQKFEFSTTHQLRKENVQITVPGTNQSIGAWVIFRQGHQSWTDPDTDTIVYVHGRDANRGYYHRVQMYKKLSEHYHVVTFDYRGFGDSTCVVITEKSLVRDTIAVIDWVKANTRSRNIRMWGHSFGTGIVLEAMYEKNDRDLNYLILESPFNNFKDALENYKYMQKISKIKPFNLILTRPILNQGFEFASDFYLGQLRSNVLILHAKDDNTVPFKLGKQLFDQNRNKTNLQMIAFRENHKFAHINIYKYTGLLDIVSSFFNDRLPGKYTEL